MADTFVFMCGLDRAGTTVLGELIGQHRDISMDIECGMALRAMVMINEIRHNVAYNAETNKMARNVIQGDPEAREYLVQGLAGAVRQWYSRKPQRLAGDKYPPYIYFTEMLREFYPGCKFVIQWREPLGTIGSWKRCPWRDHQDLHAKVKSYNEIMGHINRTLKMPDVFLVRHDEMVRNPGQVFQGLADYLEVENVFDYSRLEVRPDKPVTDEERAYILQHALPLEV